MDSSWRNCWRRLSQIASGTTASSKLSSGESWIDSRSGSNRTPSGAPKMSISKEKELERPLAIMSGRIIGVSLAPVAVADLEVEEPHLNVAIKPRQLEFPRYSVNVNSKPPTRKLTIINNGPTAIAYKLLTSDNNSYGVSSRFGIIAARSSGKSRRVDVRIFRKLADPRSGDTGDKPIKNHLQVLVTEVCDPKLTAEHIFRQPDLKCDRYKIHLLYTAIPAPAPSLAKLKGNAVNNNE